MLSWEEVVQSYTINPSDRINYQGQLIWLGNRPDCAEYYVNQKHFIHDPCMTHPNNWESGYSLLEKVAPDIYQKTFLKESENLFNMLKQRWKTLFKPKQLHTGF